MTIRNPVPPAPQGNDLTDPDWDRWFNTVNRFSSSLYDFDVTVDPTSVAANITAEQDFTVQGLGANDLVIGLSKPTLTSGIGIVNKRVKAANTLSITFINATAGAIDPPSETYKLVVIRQ